MINKFKKLYRSWLVEPYFRRLVTYWRLQYFVKIKKSLKTTDSEKAFKVTVSHNLKAISQCNDRMNLLIRPLSVIETVNRDSSVLVIGPRNEYDILSLIGHGFSKNTVKGLDLITYSPFIQLGDMHSTPFKANSLDVIICGWTLSYSATPDVFAKEMLRIIKNNGLIAIGVEYSTMTQEAGEELTGYSIQEFDRLKERVNSTKDILNLFEGHVAHVYFDHNAPNQVSHTGKELKSNVSNVAVIFSVSK